MIQTLVRNWWLLALFGVLNAAISVIYLVIQDHQDGPLALNAWWEGAFVLGGRLMLAAGACAILAGIWRSAKGRSWPLVLHGLALGALGLISGGIVGLIHVPIGFRTVALLFVTMAMSAGILELAAARTLRRQRHVADGWFLGVAGAASVGFALAFLALGFGWIRIDLWSHFRSLADFMWWKADLLWFGFYFGFSAICMLGLGLRMNSLRGDIQRAADGALPIG